MTIPENAHYIQTLKLQICKLSIGSDLLDLGGENESEIMADFLEQWPMVKGSSTQGMFGTRQAISDLSQIHAMFFDSAGARTLKHSTLKPIAQRQFQI